MSLGSASKFVHDGYQQTECCLSREFWPGLRNWTQKLEKLRSQATSSPHPNTRIIHVEFRQSPLGLLWTDCPSSTSCDKNGGRRQQLRAKHGNNQMCKSVLPDLPPHRITGKRPHRSTRSTSCEYPGSRLAGSYRTKVTWSRPLNPGNRHSKTPRHASVAPDATTTTSCCCYAVVVRLELTLGSPSAIRITRSVCVDNEVS